MFKHLPRRRLAALLVASLVLVGCGGPDAPAPSVGPSGNPPAAPETKADAANAEKTYTMTGEVKEVDRSNSSAVIKHDPIPGLMDVMTMRFKIDPPEDLDNVRVGDKVEAKLWVRRAKGEIADYHLDGLVVTEEAPSQPLSVNLATGEVTDKPKTLEIGELVPDFTFTDQTGRARRLSDERGKVVVLTFIYTRCPLPNFCPLMDGKFAGLAKLVAASPERTKNVRLISMSFDPEHDTPEVLEKHAQLRGAKPPLWTYAVAPHAELAKVMGPLGLAYGPRADEIAHNLCTAVIDRDGKLARLAVGNQNDWTPSEFLGVISKVLNKND
jgi:protein SCO1/2